MSPETRWLNDDEQKMWRAFIAMNQKLFAKFESQLMQDSGIQMAYYRILVMLSEAPKRTLRMSDLADSSLCSRSRLSHAIARLEELGWVDRFVCETDKRGANARLTDEGLAVLEAAAHNHVETVRALLFDPLSSQQVQQLGEISESVVAQLDRCPRNENESEDLDKVCGSD